MATISLQDAYTQARTFLEANQIEQAIGLIQHIIEYHPDNLEAQRLLGEAYLAQRDLPAAVATFEQVLQADPENIPAHVGLGMAYEWQGRLDKAIAEFEQALEIRPDMPELRAQLVRLYTEAWGSEHAALRLSRSGLARLYARGQMLPQAILEFRNVVDEHPNRLDAWVGLIEALWRNDQLDEAVAVCQQVLKQHPLLLKANLILGAILLNNGDQRGIEYWRIAQRLDPYQTVARMLFDPLPSGIPIPDVSLPEWNEAEWQARRSAAAAPVSATAPAPDDFFAEASWLTPTVQSAPVAASAASDDDLLAMLLFSPTVATSVVEPPPSAAADHDTFLDSLLSSTSTPTGLTLDEIGVDVSRAPITPSEPTLQPFSLEELGLSAEEIAQLEGQAPAAEPELKPFSLEELGLSAEEIAQLEGQAPAAEPELKPFSLEDLGLSAEEIAQLEGQAPAAEPELKPFSLEELGLSAEEIAQLEGQAPAAEPELKPFSLEELGLSSEEIAQLRGASALSTPTSGTETFDDDLSGLQPFSLDDLEFGSATTGSDLPSALQPFSLDDLALDEEMTAPPESSTETIEPGIYSWQEPSSRSSGIQIPQEAEPTGPSIFSKLLERASHLPPFEEPPLSSVELTEADVAAYFSSDDVSLREEDDSEERLTGTFRIPKTSLDESLAPTGAVSALSEKKEDVPTEPELTPFSLEELGLSPEEIAQLEAAQQPQATGETVAFTDESIDNLIATASSDESDIFAHLEPAATTDETSFEIPGVEPISFEEFASLEPFSFDDIEGGTTTTSELGISPEEIEGIELGNFETVVLSDNEEPMIDTGDPDLNRLIQLGYRQGYVDLTDIIAVVKDPEREADRIEQIGWSLYRAGIQIRDGDEIIDMEAELGEEEPAGVSPTVSADLTPFDESPANPAEPELTPFSLEELGLSPEEIAQLEAAQQQAQPAPAEPELTPFSLEELGLSPEEIAQLEAAQQQAQPAPAEPELTPFSLEELGLSPEEIAQLEAAQQQAQPADAEPELKPFSLEELGLSPEEIAQLEAARQTQPQPETAVTSEDDLFDFSVAETAPVAKAVRTAPRREEPPRTPAPEDIGFVPEPLDALDDIWQTPPELPKAEPARVVLPPLGERAKSQPTSRPSVSEERRNVTPTRDDLRFARREAASSGRGRSARAPLRPRAPEDFIPTGNTTIDDYLRQLSSNPTNHALAFTIARLCAQTGQAELMAVIYRRLLKHSNLLAQMAEELEDLINTVEERPVLRQLYRILGDVYSRQGRLEEAIATYSATFAE
jgi:tetratricopeptide (TPR) repeat protein